MPVAVWIILAILLVLALIIINIYNNLVKARQKVKNALSQIDVQLQRRFDLIPNLVESVKGYMSHEEEVLSKITELRTSWAGAQSIGDKARIDNELSGTLKSIMAVSENYPELRANDNFLQLQGELKITEDKIGYSRQFYNDTVTKYNTQLEVFPSSLFASMFGFKPEDLYKVETEEARKNVRVDFGK